MREADREKIGELEPCSYLPNECSRMHYHMIRDCSSASWTAMLERGWRRFGSLFFRPGCDFCYECRSLRVEAAAFCPSRSMRRCWRRNQDLRVVVGTPTISEDHLNLYQRYHADMAARRGWKERRIQPLEYFLTFVEGHHEFGLELLFLDGDRLLCVSLVDILPQAVSAVYCYYDPEQRRRGLGVYSILHQIALARARNIPHVYLGYWIADNPSMRYKVDYQPHQILRGRPEHDQEPEWYRPPLSDHGRPRIEAADQPL